MNKELLKQAIGSDAAALSRLRDIAANLTIFVREDDKVSIDATMDAWQYYTDMGYPPLDWEDEPTLTFVDAFPRKLQRNPLNLRPVTPGMWSRLWEGDNGHELVAAIYWGRQQGHIRDSDPAIKVWVRALLNDTAWPLLDEVVKMMGRNKEQAACAMRAVLAPVAQERAAPAAQDAQERAAPAAQDALEVAYQRGEIDIGRYLKLKAAPQDSTWSHEKYIALGHVIGDHFSLSEVQGLIFDMGLDRDDFPSRRNSAARELAQWAKRRKQLDKLSGLVKAANPHCWFAFAAEWL